MDDARLADEMTLDGIAKQLDAIRSDIADVKTDLAGVKTGLANVNADVTGLRTDGTSMRGELAALRTEMREGFAASKIRDEKLRSLAKLGLEANQGLLETITARFDATDKKHGEEISLLQLVLRNQGT